MYNVQYEYTYLEYKINWYSVMQSDVNSFCGDVVSDSFNKTSQEEDNIFCQIYKSKYVRISNMVISILYGITRRCILTLQ